MYTVKLVLATPSPLRIMTFFVIRSYSVHVDTKIQYLEPKVTSVQTSLKYIRVVKKHLQNTISKRHGMGHFYER